MDPNMIAKMSVADRDQAFPSTGFFGLTRRELFAAMALQGLLADPEQFGDERDFAKRAVLFGDALIAELDKEVK